MNKKIAAVTWVDVIAKICHFLLAGLVLMYVWEKIAYEYNQPTFAYWTCVGAYWLIHCLLTAGRGKK